MPRVCYRLKLLEPVICSALEGEPNSAVSYDMIPGSAMRGVLIGRYLRNGNEIDPADGESARLFFSDEVLFRNATLVVNDQAGRVVPATWKRRKRGGDRTEVRDVVFDRDGFGNEKSGTPAGYAVVAEENLYIGKPLPQINVHVQRSRRRKDKKSGQYREGSPLPYRYDALAAGQTFEGEVWCQSEPDAQTLLKLFQSHERLTIGGATNAGYGSAEIVSAEVFGDASAEVINGGELVITLLSDCILRNVWGEYDPSLATLAAALGGEVDLERSSIDTTLVGGFNRKWGLPLPQTPCLKAGSVVVFRAAEHPKELLREALRTGLGERTNEGFGQIAVNWQSQDPYQLGSVSDLEADSTVPEMDGDALRLWQRIQRFAESDADPVNRIFAAENPYPVRGNVTRTQLQRLRNQIGDALRGEKEVNYRDFIESFFDDIQGKEADRQYEQARLRGGSLKKWLLSPHFQEELSERDKLRFVDAVLERAAKETRGA